MFRISGTLASGRDGWRTTRAGIVRLVLVSVLAVLGCKEKDKPAQSIAPIDGLAAVPAEVTTIVAADLRVLAKNPLVRRAVGEMLHRDADLKRRTVDLVAECKLEPGKDITGLVIAMGETRDQAMLVAQGLFDEARLATCVGKSMSASGGELTRESVGQRVIYKAIGTAGERPVYFTLGSPKTLIAASSRVMLDLALGDGPKVKSNRRLGELLARAKSGGPLWAVGLVPAAIGQGLVGKAGVKKPPQAMVLGADFQAGLALHLDVEMVDEDDAKSAVSLAKPQLAAASLVAQKDGLGTLVKRIEVGSEGRWMTLSLTVPASELGEILARVQRTVDRSPPPQQNPPSKGSPPAGQQE